nr:MAG TPA: Cytokine-induced anti-apoptosis inhibitor 1 [Caudoviricetes sp.]
MIQSPARLLTVRTMREMILYGDAYVQYKRRTACKNCKILYHFSPVWRLVSYSVLA